MTNQTKTCEDFFPSLEEIQNHVDITPIEEMEGIPLGKITDDISKCVSVNSKSSDRKVANGNIMVYGTSGAGKVNSFVDPYLYKVIDKDESFVVVDDKGDVYSDTYQYAVKNKYDIKVFNCDEPEKGNSIHLLKYVGTDQEKADLLANVLLCNFNIPQDDSSSYSSAIHQFLKACILYITEEYEWEYRSIDNPNSHYSRLNEIKEKVTTEEYTKEQQEEAIAKENQRWEKAIEPIHGFGTIGRLYDLINGNLYDYDNDLQAFKPAEKKKASFFNLSYGELSQYEYIQRKYDEALLRTTYTHPGIQSWRSFQAYPEQFKELSIASTITGLRIFQKYSIRQMLSVDDIDIEKIGNEKTAIYMLVDPLDVNKKVVSALFMTLLIKGLMKTAKGNEDRKLKVKTHIVLNEYFSVGYIPGIEQDLCLCRTYGMSMIFIIQNRAQLMMKHPDTYKIIESNCAIIYEMDDSRSVFVIIPLNCTMRLSKLYRNEMPQWGEIKDLPPASIYRYLDDKA